MKTSRCEFTINVTLLLLWTAYGSRVAVRAWGDGGFGRFSVGPVVSSEEIGAAGQAQIRRPLRRSGPLRVDTHVVAGSDAACVLRGGAWWLTICRGWRVVRRRSVAACCL